MSLQITESDKEKLALIERIFKPGGALSESLPGYEYRDIQLQSALCCAKAILGNKHAMIEAGCGCGKTFSNIIPDRILAKPGRHTIIATESNALLDQYYNKDLPRLQQILKPYCKFTFAKAKGRNNFICRNRLDEYMQETGLGLSADTDRDQHNMFMDWALSTKTGDKGELDFPLDDKIWQKVCCEDICKKSGCMYYNQGTCHFQSARKRFKDTDVIVTNYTLYLLDAVIGGYILVPHDVAVFDEGHTLVEIAQQTLGTEIKSRTMQGFTSYVHRMLAKQGLWPDDTKFDLLREEIEQSEKELWATLQKLKPVEKANFQLRLDEMPSNVTRDSTELAQNLHDTMLHLARVIQRSNTCDAYSSLRHDDMLTQLKGKLNEHMTNLGTLFILRGFEEAREDYYASNWCTYLEVDASRGNMNSAIYKKPVDVAPLLRGMIFDKARKCGHDKDDCDCVKTVIVTSATLAVAGRFDFPKKELGVDDPEQIIVGSPFDYKTQMKAYFANQYDIPDRDEVGDKKYYDAVAKAVTKTILATHGGAFILFTSYRDMQQVYDRIVASNKIPDDIKMFRQGEKSRQALTDDFKEDIDSVLFATKSFWTGVDVPGMALRCVVMVKMPFRVPDDKMYAAKCDLIDKRGGKWFFDYAIPLMVADVRQGVGRLIRHREDEGLLVWLDPRIFTKSYGKLVLNSLPPRTLLSDIPEHLFDSYAGVVSAAAQTDNQVEETGFSFVVAEDSGEDEESEAIEIG